MEELVIRVQARHQQVGLHQGTLADLNHELNTIGKVIYAEDYDVVIDTNTTSLDESIQIIHSFLSTHCEEVLK